MRTLQELPHRFWPASQVPADVKVWPKMLNLKTAEFAKVYNKKVNPRLRALGFTCKGMRGRGRAGDVVFLSWFAGGKAGGSGSLAFAAHRVGLPSALHHALAPDDVDYSDCNFYRLFRLFDDRHHGADFDLGKDVAEAEETCERLLEVVEEQGLQFLAAVPRGLAELTALRVDEFEARAPELATSYPLRVAGSALSPAAEPRIDLVVLLARLAVLDGRRDDAQAWARLGLALLAGAAWPPYAHHERSILFEKLLAGDFDLPLTAADRAERERRFEQSRQ
ncbi:hypothetical protein [Nannocystis punicea]|uniref:Uncharacterized protein n=1 Tax=Nannocystis punicea TaxID=2995304 RepID=A0ABY7GVS9_9BACT|nr:hypothetical protein [Nannocystis poenicansa]WAS91068.1 hypothetical protein O0S08_33185 [Nannocystis poenicansa]